MALYGGNKSNVEKKSRANLGFRSWFLIWQYAIGATLSVPVLVTGILIARATKDDCATFMNKPIIAMGALLLFVSLVGLFAAIFDKLSRNPMLVWLHLLIMFLLVSLLFCFSIFCLEITNKGLAHNVKGYGQSYKEYRLYEYPKWMRRRVDDVSYWSKVKKCLQESSLCEADVLPYVFSNITYKSLASLTPIQRGCCIPPSACNVTYLGVSSSNTINTQKDNGKKIHVPNQHGNEGRTTTKNIIQGSTTSTISSTINSTSQENDKNITRILNKTLESTKNTTRTSNRYDAIDTTIHAYVHDCKHWSDIPEQLCYDCDTCKAGIIQDSMDRWRIAGIIFDVLVTIMIISYALFACYGFKERQRIKGTKVPSTVGSI